MTAEELIELLQERPFKPLRLHLADGRTREIRHPEMAIVAVDSVAIGVAADDQTMIATKITHCSIPNIVEIEPFEIDQRGEGNGERGPKKRRGR
jgi:hypothetical protein